MNEKLTMKHYKGFLAQYKLTKSIAKFGLITAGLQAQLHALDEFQAA